MFARFRRLFRRRPLSSEELDALAQNLDTGYHDPPVRADSTTIGAAVNYSRPGKLGKHS